MINGQGHRTGFSDTSDRTMLLTTAARLTSFLLISQHPR